MIGQMMTLSTNQQSVEAVPCSSLIILYPAYIWVCVSELQIPDEMVVLGQGIFYIKISVPVMQCVLFLKIQMFRSKLTLLITEFCALTV